MCVQTGTFCTEMEQNRVGPGHRAVSGKVSFGIVERGEGASFVFRFQTASAVCILESVHLFFLFSLSLSHKIALHLSPILLRSCGRKQKQALMTHTHPLPNVQSS